MSEDLISRAALYERAVTLEAQALDYVGKLIERDGDEPSTEWRIWSAILNERTAFKHDVCDAPSAQPGPRWIPVTERLPEKHEEVLVTVTKEIVIAWIYLDGRWRSNDCPETYLNDHITAWMPLPEPYREENE